MFTASNPATGETVGTYPAHSTVEMRAALRRADKTWKSWRQTSFAERAGLIRGVGQLLRDRADRYGRLMAVRGRPLWTKGGLRDGCQVARA